MAKKKKLNKQVVILLSLLGVVILVGIAGAVVLKMPKDVAALMAKGDAEYQNKNYKEADRFYSEAIGAARKANQLTPEMLNKQADMLTEWSKAPVLTQTELREKIIRIRDNYRKALLINPGDLKSQQRLAEWSWQYDAPAKSWMAYIKEADALLKLDSKDHKTYFRRAVANGEMAKTMGTTYVEPAREDFQKALELKGDEPQYWINYADFLRRFDPPQAEPTYKKAIETIKDSAIVYVAYGDFLASDKDRTKEAQAQYEQSVKVDPKNLLGYLSLSRFYQGQNDLEKARQKLMEAKGIDPTDHRPWGELASIANRQGKPAESLAILRQGIEAVVPKTTTATSGPAEGAEENEQRRVEFARADLYYKLVISLLDLTESKDQDRAKLIEEAKSYRDRLAPMGKAAIDRVDGRIALSEGRLDDARKMLESACESSAVFDPQTSYLLAEVYMMLRMSGKAQPIIDKFTTTPGYEQVPIGHILKTQVFIQAKDWDSALKEINQALVKQPGNRTALQLKADIEAIRSGTLPKEELTTERVPQYLDRAVSLWLEDRKDEATKLVEELHERLPDNLPIISQLAMFYMADKKEDKAKTLLAAAQKKFADNPRITRALNLLGEPNADKRMEAMLLEKDAGTDEPLVKAMEKARIYQMFGKAEDYLKQLGEAAKIDPKSLAVVDAQFRVALGGKEKNWDLAADCARRAGEVNPLYGKVYNARIAMIKGEFAQAATILNDLLRERPDDKMLRVMLADNYMQLNDLLRAEQEYHQVVEVDPGYTEGLVGMARVTELLGRWSDHAQYVERAYKLAPQHPYLQQEHLKIQVDKLKPAEAIQALEGWRKKNPDDAQNLLRLAGVYEKDHQLEKAEELYKYLYEKADNKLLPARWLISFYMRNNRPEVEGILNQITKSSDKVGAYILYGDVRALQGTKESIDQAKGAYNQAIDLSDAKEPRAFQAIANFYATRGMFAEAVEAQRKYMERQPGAAGEKMLAKMLIEAGQLSEAENVLSRVLKGSPADAEAMVDSATLLVRQGKLTEAVKMLDSAVQANPGNTEPLLRRASLLIVLGESERAREDLKTVHRVAPVAEALRMAAGLYLRLRDEESAESMYNEALNRQEEFRPAMQELAQLYLTQRKWDRLDPLLQKAKRLFPQVVQFYQMEAEMWKKRIDPVKRVAALEEAYKVNQERFVVAEYVSGLYEANKADKGLEICGKETKTGAWLDALKARGMVQMKNRAEGEDLFKKAMKDAPAEDVVFVLDQADKALGSKDSLAAIESWTSVRPNDWVVLAKLADLHSRLRTNDSLKKAVELLNKAFALAQKPEHKAEIDSGLGVTFHQLYDLNPADKQYLGEAEKHYLAALDALKGSPNPSCLNNLAYMYAESDQAQKGLPFAEQAVKMLSNNSDVLDTYGWTLLKLGKTDLAEMNLVRSLQGEHPAPVCRYHLGYLYEQAQNLDKAKIQYQMGLNMFNQEGKEDKVYKLLQDGLTRVQEKARSTK